MRWPLVLWAAWATASCNTVVVEPRAPAVCAGRTCLRGEFCCYTTGLCFRPEDAATECPQPASTLEPNRSVPCASDFDCQPGEYCDSDRVQDRCLSTGFCHSRSNCGFCSSGNCPVCGCDGITYPSTQAICDAGVREAARGPCGVGVTSPIPEIGCGSRDQCPDGQDCCFITGLCFALDRPWACTLAPDGSVPNCITNADCASGGSGGGGGGSGSGRYCAGEGCTTPGFCANRPSNCGGLIAVACGCDGNMYTNECTARAAGTRVSSCDGG